MYRMRLFRIRLTIFLQGGCQKYQRFQDDNHLVYLKKTNIPQALRKHGLNFLKIAREANYTLLENNLPGICADRIDYSLRMALHFREFERREIVYLLKHLKTQNEKWYFDNLIAGRKFAKLFRKMNDDYFSNEGVAIMFYSLKEFFRYAVRQKYVTKKDFIFSDDEEVLRKIKRYLKKDKLLTKLYNNLRHSEIYQVSVKKISDNVIYCKSRIVDPPILYAGTISRLSLIDKSYSKILKEDLKPNKFYVK